MEATHTYARVPTYKHTLTHKYTHSLTHTHTLTHAHARTRTHTHIHTQGVASHILCVGISREGAFDRHSGVSPDGKTAQVHVTNFVN